MSKSPFRAMRAIPDKVLGRALTSHSEALRYVIQRVAAYDRWRWVRLVWYLAVTLALGYLYVG